MNDVQKFLLLASLLLLGFLIYLLAPVLMPFIAAAMLAYVADPLADKLERLGLKRTVAAAIVFIGMTSVAIIALVILVPLLQKQILVFVGKIPQYLNYAQETLVPWLQTRLGIDTSSFGVDNLEQTLQENWRSAGGLVAKLLTSLTHSGLVLGHWLMNLTIISVVTFYLLRDWDRLVASVRGLLPRRLEPTVASLAKQSDEVLSAFLRGQLLVMLALGTIYSAGLAIAGLELALLIGMLAGLVSFVPYLGFIVGIGVAGVAAVLQFHDLTHLMYVFAVFGVGQVLESVLLTPLLVGDRIGLHPVAVMFAVLAGGQLFGFVGVLLALPVAAVLAVIVRYVHQRYRESGLYGVELADSGEAD